MLIIEDKADLLEPERPRSGSPSPQYSRRITSQDLSAKLQNLIKSDDSYYQEGSVLPTRRYGGYSRNLQWDVISVRRSVDSLRSDVLQRNRQALNKNPNYCLPQKLEQYLLTINSRTLNQRIVEGEKAQKSEEEISRWD